MQTNQRAPRLVLRGALPPLERLRTFGAPTPPAWELTFLCDGMSFKSLQRGRNAQAAAAEAMMELTVQFHEFNYQEARLVSAVQVQ